MLLPYSSQCKRQFTRSTQNIDDSETQIKTYVTKNTGHYALNIILMHKTDYF